MANIVPLHGGINTDPSAPQSPPRRLRGEALREQVRIAVSNALLTAQPVPPAAKSSLNNLSAGEQALLRAYRRADERGRRTIQEVATLEHEAAGGAS